MGLFRKKKTEINTDCHCDLNAQTIQKTAETKTSHSGIKILGFVCKKYNALESALKGALFSLEINDSIEHVTDFTQIAMVL